MVADEFSIIVDKIISGAGRYPPRVLLPAQVAMAIARDLNYGSTRMIGRVIGRDHTHVVRASKRINELALDTGFATWYLGLVARVAKVNKALEGR